MKKLIEKQQLLNNPLRFQFIFRNLTIFEHTSLHTLGLSPL